LTLPWRTTAANVGQLLPDLFRIPAFQIKTKQVNPLTPPRNLKNLQSPTQLSAQQRAQASTCRALSFTQDKKMVMFPARHSKECRAVWKGAGPHYCYSACESIQDSSSCVEEETQLDAMSVKVSVASDTVIECGCGKKIVSLFTKAVKANFGSPKTSADKAGNMKNVIACLSRKFKKRKYTNISK
jgi:hypothetical protein